MCREVPEASYRALSRSASSFAVRDDLWMGERVGLFAFVTFDFLRASNAPRLIAPPHGTVFICWLRVVASQGQTLTSAADRARWVPRQELSRNALGATGGSGHTRMTTAASGNPDSAEVCG